MVVLVGEVRNAREWRKREKLMSLVYDFEGQEPAEKRNALSRLKVLSLLMLGHDWK